MHKLFPGLGHDDAEQMLVRWTYVAILWVFASWQGALAGDFAIALIAQLLLISAHTLHARLRPQDAVLRRKVGVVVDQVPPVVALAFASPVVAPLFFFFGTISVGYGLRFGPGYCVASALIAGVGLSVVTIVTPAFRAEWVWMVGVIGLVSLVPLYSAYLSVRLQRRQQRLQEQADAMAYAASHDAMTGLANRAHFLHVLAAELQQRVGRTPGLAVLFIDLDGFKGVNDQHGHAAGDALLMVVAKCLEQSVRSGDLVARIGGDEFAVLLREILRPDEVPLLVDAMQACLRESMCSDKTFAGSGASIGWAVYAGTAPCPDADTLLREADAAMYEAKARRRAQLRTGIPEASKPSASTVPQAHHM